MVNTISRNELKTKIERTWLTRTCATMRKVSLIGLMQVCQPKANTNTSWAQNRQRDEERSYD